MDPKSGEFWWVRVKLTPPLSPLPYEKGEIRLARVLGGSPPKVRLIDCIHISYLHLNHVEFIERIVKPEES